MAVHVTLLLKKTIKFLLHVCVWDHGPGNIVKVSGLCFEGATVLHFVTS